MVDFRGHQKDSEHWEDTLGDCLSGRFWLGRNFGTID